MQVLASLQFSFLFLTPSPLFSVLSLAARRSANLLRGVDEKFDETLICAPARAHESTDLMHTDEYSHGLNHP